MAQIQYSRVHRMMPIYLGLVVVLLAIAVGSSFGYEGRLLAVKIPVNNLLKAQIAPTLDMTQQIVAPESGIQKLEIPEPNKLPLDVEAWLQHLQRIEKKRGKLAMDQVSTAMVTMAKMQLAGAASQLESALGGSTDDLSQEGEPKTPASELSSDFKKQKNAWLDLVTEFNSLEPPQECFSTKTAYESALRETAAMMNDLIGILEQASDGSTGSEILIQKLNGMKGSSKTIDESGKLTDERVQEICDKYKVKKWFSISSDFGGGGLLSGGF